MNYFVLRAAGAMLVYVDGKTLTDLVDDLVEPIISALRLWPENDCDGCCMRDTAVP